MKENNLLNLLWKPHSTLSERFFEFCRSLLPSSEFRRVVLILTFAIIVWLGIQLQFYILELPVLDQMLLSLTTILAGGIFSLWLAQKFNVPDYLLFIIMGILLQPFINLPGDTMEEFTIIGGAIILFLSGFEIEGLPRKKISLSLSLISTLGLIITAVILAVTITRFSSLTIFTSVLLALALMAIDSTALIPILANLKFKNPLIKIFAISESAYSSVIATVLAFTFAGLAGSLFYNFDQIRSAVLTTDTLLNLIQALSVGAIVGLAFGALMSTIAQEKKELLDVKEVFNIPLLFLALALGAFALAKVLGGSGFVAAFMTGIIFRAEEHHKPAVVFLNEVLIVAKIVILILFGSLINLSELVEFLPEGIIIGLIFIFIIRPAVVLLITFIDLIRGNLTLNEILFLSWTRETGLISAILLIIFLTMGITGASEIIHLGLVIILTTLIIQPALTPFLAKKLNLVN